jgi:hypothetical protein
MSNNERATISHIDYTNPRSHIPIDANVWNRGRRKLFAAKIRILRSEFLAKVTPLAKLSHFIIIVGRPPMAVCTQLYHVLLAKYVFVCSSTGRGNSYCFVSNDYD